MRRPGAALGLLEAIVGIEKSKIPKAVPGPDLYTYLGTANARLATRIPGGNQQSPGGTKAA